MSTVLCQQEGAIAWIRLNRPEHLNAMNARLVEELTRALQQANADPIARVIILHGAGRAFCSGDDLKDLDAQTASAASTQAWIEAIQQVTRQIMQSDKIVIAAIHGWCVGGALEWAINCDFRLFAENTRWFFPEVSYGLFVTGGVTSLLSKQLGLQHTKELMIFGDKHDADSALRLGIAWKIVPEQALLIEARRYALAIAAKPARVLSDIKRAINTGLHASLEEAMAFETEATVRAFLSPEAQAHVNEFRKSP